MGFNKIVTHIVRSETEKMRNGDVKALPRCLSMYDFEEPAALVKERLQNQAASQSFMNVQLPVSISGSVTYGTLRV